MSKKKYQDKPIYWGYYGNLRGEWMKEHEKELFHALEEAGELDSYLYGFQESYVAKAKKLRPKVHWQVHSKRPHHRKKSRWK